MIRVLEELAANAWPGLRSVHVDGWVTRFAEGYSRRANSVLPLYEGQTPLEARIARCEALAALRGVPSIFKLQPAALPENLDAALAQRGYLREADTHVMVLDRLPATAAMPEEGLKRHVSSTLTPDWFDFYAGTGSLDERQRAAAQAIMEHIVPCRRFILLEGEDGPVACALAVVEDGWVGVFDVAVRKDARGRGLGRRIMEAVFDEATSAGAQRSYLQVVSGNAVAQALYRKLGYDILYTYWYRVRKEAA